MPNNNEMVNNKGIDPQPERGNDSKGHKGIGNGNGNGGTVIKPGKSHALTK